MENLTELILSVVTIALAAFIYLYTHEKKERRKYQDYLYTAKAPGTNKGVINVQELRVSASIDRLETALASPSMVDDKINRAIGRAITEKLIDQKLINIYMEGDDSKQVFTIKGMIRVITD